MKAGSAGWPLNLMTPARSTTRLCGMPDTLAAAISSWPTLQDSPTVFSAACERQLVAGLQHAVHCQ